MLEQRGQLGGKETISAGNNSNNNSGETELPASGLGPSPILWGVPFEPDAALLFA